MSISSASSASNEMASAHLLAMQKRQALREPVSLPPPRGANSFFPSDFLRPQQNGKHQQRLCEVCQSVLFKLGNDVKGHLQDTDDVSELTEAMRSFFLCEPGDDKESQGTTNDGPPDRKNVDATVFYSRITFDDFGGKDVIDSKDGGSLGEDFESGSELSESESESDSDSDSEASLEDIFKAVFEELEWRYRHYNTPQLLIESANSGCGLCYQFLHSVEEDDLDLQEITPANGLIRVVNTKGSRHWNLEIDFGIRDWDEPLSVGLFPIAEAGLLGNLSSSKSTKDALPLAKQWLSACLKTHPECGNGSKKRLPTRLIQLGETTSWLVYSSKIVGHPQYATLSHRWDAPGKHTTLEQKRLAEFREKIPPDALSRTFKDAIIAAKQLGLEYIWIDSICIVQDDPEDWARESAKMSSVYGNSTINLSAAAADGAMGIFSDRDPGWCCQTSVLPNGNKTLGTPYICLAEDFYQLGLSQMPLMSRGWVFQERLLAPRTLHFTPVEVFWECNCVTACETFIHGLPEEVVAKDYSSDDSPNFQKRRLSSDMWTWIVSGYSRTFLSFEADKLIAISGIAKELIPIDYDQDAEQQPYLAGMWRANLQNELCWYIDDMERTPEAMEDGAKNAYTNRDYIAPSWSWASTDEPINYPWKTPQEKFLYEVLDATTTPLKETKFGAVSHGNLRVSCEAFFRCKISCKEIPGTHQPNGPNYIRINGVDFRYSIFLDRDIHREEVGERELFLVPCYHHLEYFKGKTMGVWAMVLEATGGPKGQFRRCGQVGNLAPSGWKYYDDPWFSTTPNGISESKDCVEVVVTENGSKRYVIDIV